MDLDVVVKKGAIKDDFGLRLKQFLKVEQAKARTVWTVHLSLVKSEMSGKEQEPEQTIKCSLG